MKNALISFVFTILSTAIIAQSTNSCVINNAGFENGNLTGWTFRSGGYGVQTPCPTGTCPRYGTTWTGGIIGGGTNSPLNGTSRHTLMTTAGGNDPNATAPAVPVVAPGGGNYSFRLGNSATSGSTVTGMADAEAARLTFAVSNQNALFTYMYSFFVNNPGHTYVEQPSFEAVVLDQNDNVIPCGQYFVVAGNNAACVNAAGFINGNNGYVYKPWSSVSLDLTGYIGQNISVEFRTTDCLPVGGSSSTMCSNGTCTLTTAAGSCTYPSGQPPCTPTGGGSACAAGPGTHSAYAYIDAYCAPLSVTQPAFCAGASSIQICAPAGYSSYSWPSGQAGITGSPATQCVTVNNPVAGATYTVNMVSFTGCPTTTTVTLTGFNFTLNDTTICGNGGSFPLTLTPSVPGNYTYTWTPAAGLSCTNCQSPVYTPNGSNATYSVTMASSGPGACTFSDAVNITVQPTANVTGTGATVCSGQNATLSANGQTCGTPITNYSWSPATFLSSTTGGTVTAVNPTSSVVYTVTATSGAQVATTTVQLTVNPLPTITPTGTTICNGSAGTISASGAATYTWTPGNATGTSTSVNPTTTSIYTVTGTSAAGCINSNTVQVVVNPIPVITVNSPSICASQTATLTASGGTSYTWSNGSSGNPITVSPANNTSYTVTGTSNGCSSTAVANVNVGQNISINVNSPSVCPGQAATLTASGATTYTWSTGSNANSITVNPNSTTTYTVNGSTGLCNGTNTATVTILPLPNVQGTGATVCNGTSASISASGASSYTWTPGNSTGANISVNPTATTTYTVTGTSAAGCVNSNTVQVVVNPIPVVNVNSPSICPGQTATLTASGATTYAWSNGASGSSVTVNPNVNTSYTVTGTSLGCSSTAVANVTLGTSAQVTVNSPTICVGQSATLSAGGATTYTWSTGSNNATITVNPTTTTSYTVTGAIGTCIGTNTTTVSVNPLPVITVNSPTICAGDIAQLTASGATTYTWSAGAQSTGAASANASPATSTSYTVTGSLLGCVSDAVSNVTVNAVPVIILTGDTICNGQTATVSASGANTYVWSSGLSPVGANSANGTPQATTTYTVIGSSNGCFDTSSVTVLVNPIPIVTVNSPTICAGQTANIIASGANSYNWSSGTNPSTGSNVSVTPGASSSFTVTGTSNNCSSDAVSFVTVNPIPVITLSADSICAGQTSTLVANGAASYTWSAGATSNGPSTATASPNQTSTYTVTGTTLGCVSTQTVSILVNPIPNVTVNSSSICAGQTATLAANGANSYSWTGGIGNGTSGTVSTSPGSTQQYTVTGTTDGCSSTAVATISVTPIPILSVTTNPVCAGSTANVVAAGATTYQWPAGFTGGNGANATYVPTNTSNYTLIGTTNGCTDSINFNIVVNPIPIADFSGPQAGCAPQVVSFADSSQGAFGYTWNFGDGSVSSQANPVHVYSQPGVYSVTLTVISMNGCTNTSIQNNIIQVYPNPDAEIVSTNYSASELEPTIYFSDYSTYGYNCMLYFGDGTSMPACGFTSLGHTYGAAGVYCASLAVTTQYGCYDSASVCVEIIPEFTFYVPNAFTPNGNGDNEVFYGYGTNIIEYEMMIFDRWGELIFTSHQLNTGWDGRYKNEVVQEDVYVYKIKLKDIFNKKHEYHGTVTVVR